MTLVQNIPREESKASIINLERLVWWTQDMAETIDCKNNGLLEPIVLSTH